MTEHNLGFEEANIVAIMPFSKHSEDRQQTDKFYEGAKARMADEGAKARMAKKSRDIRKNEDASTHMKLIISTVLLLILVKLNQKYIQNNSCCVLSHWIIFIFHQ